MNLNVIGLKLALGLLVSVAPGCAAQRKVSMPTPNTHDPMVLSAVRLSNAPAIDLLRLVQAPKSTELLFSSTGAQGARYQTTIFGVSIGDQPTPAERFKISHLLPPPPSWDVTIGADAAPACVIENAGGAVNSLFLQRGDSRISVTQDYPLKSFSSPRFFRGELKSALPYISATADNTTLAAFLPQANKYGQYLPVMDCVDGLLLKSSEGYTVLCKRYVPGPARNNVLPGILQFGKLDENLKPKGEMLTLLDKTPIFEFDADTFRGASQDTLVIVATTAEDMVLTIGSPSRNSFARIPVTGLADKRSAMRPAVLVNKGQICAAVIDSFHTPSARILAGVKAVPQ